MMSRATLSHYVCAALAVVGCTAHQPVDEQHADVCPSTPLRELIEGSWKVGYAIYEGSQKPPSQRPIGELQITGCRYRFIASEDPEVEPELVAAQEEFPFVRTRSGAVELLSEYGDDPSENFWTVLGSLRLRTDPRIDGSASWEGVLNRKGEYLFFRPLDSDTRMHGSVSRGKYVRGPDEYIRGSDPEAPPPKGMLERMRERERESMP
jgi:hypothetical protein